MTNLVRLKNPSLLFSGDLEQNIDNNLKINNFEHKYNLRTLYIPSEKVNSNTEIDDDLFEQYFNKESIKSSLNSNIQKLFITNSKELFSLNFSNPDFTYELNFIKNKILITNEDNYTKLILNLLNVLSLWFDFCILDLHPYALYAYFKIVCIFKFTYRLLIKIDAYLYRLI